MPSYALRKFQNKMMKDVDRMIDTHTDLQGGTAGNKGLGHLTRSGILFLCVAWELYIEEVALEAIDAVADQASSPDILPLKVKKALSKYVKDHKNELQPLAMAGDGWMTMYKAMGQAWVDSLNTPKPNNIDMGFTRLLGLEDLSGSWGSGPDAINDFVVVRGGIAHKGIDAGNVHSWQLRDNYRPTVHSCAIDTDNTIQAHIRTLFPDAGRPWNKTTNPYTF